MIKEAINRILELAKLETIEVNGFPYTKEALHRIAPPQPNAIEAKTLTALVDYIKNKTDNSQIATEQLIVHIISPSKVMLMSELRSDKARDNYINCNAQLPNIMFEKFLPSENFNIMMQSCFTDNGDKGIVLQVVGNIQDQNVATYGDDGTSQSVVVKTGTVTLNNVLVPNPVMLSPYRTFPEIAQPLSNFVFRMREGAQAALFEADGGRWKNDAMDMIKEYLQEQLKDYPHVKIIA